MRHGKAFAKIVRALQAARLILFSKRNCVHAVLLWRLQRKRGFAADV
jgi:hypothetical protein